MCYHLCMRIKRLTKEELLQEYLAASLDSIIANSLADAVESRIPDASRDMQNKMGEFVEELRNEPELLYKESRKSEPDALNVPIDRNSQAYRDFKRLITALEASFNEQYDAVKTGFTKAYASKGISLIIK